jgi:hypothetical protein
MTLEELKAQHPGLYKAVLDEGHATGHAAGYQEGLKAGEEKGKAEGILVGAESEGKRLEAIEALNIPGAEAIVADAKKDRTATAENTALKIIQHQKNTAIEGAKQRRGELEALTEIGQTIQTFDTTESSAAASAAPTKEEIALFQSATANINAQRRPGAVQK